MPTTRGQRPRQQIITLTDQLRTEEVCRLEFGLDDMRFLIDSYNDIWQKEQMARLSAVKGMLMWPRTWRSLSMLLPR